jgi:GNAT superfamily N-acetyltransferase
MSHQLIYRQERTEPFQVDLPVGFRFVFCNGIRDGLQIAGLLRKRPEGGGSVVKDLLKLATPARLYACLIGPAGIASECYVTVGHCRHYEVEKNAAVLGPVWSDPAWRGKGLATRLLKLAMSHLLSRGYPLFYIDTSDQNIAMRHVIERCGFGAPVKEIPKTGPVR